MKILFYSFTFFPMKKSILFSSLAILIAWFVIVTNKVNAENYSEEFKQAYSFAYKNGITTTNSIEKAQMDSPLTRIAMAKMLSQFAMNVLWKKPSNSIVPTFSDISKELNEEYWWAVDLAYQLWIMWINMKNNEFRPHASVTRAEFSTALSRMLYGLEDGNPYYTTHLKKLKEEWIITNDNPSIKEKRWYVMIMLMRSNNNWVTSNWNNWTTSNEGKYLYLNENEKYLDEKEVKAAIEQEEWLKKGSLYWCSWSSVYINQSSINDTLYENRYYTIECNDWKVYGYKFYWASWELKKFQVIWINTAEEIALNDAKLWENIIDTIEHDSSNGGQLYIITIKTKDNNFIYFIENDWKITNKYKIITEEQALEIMLKEVDLEQSLSDIKDGNDKICSFNIVFKNYNCSFNYLWNKYTSYINAQDWTFVDRNWGDLYWTENVIIKQI